jgi:mannan endo-1,4-beta-mannosidase
MASPVARKFPAGLVLLTIAGAALLANCQLFSTEPNLVTNGNFNEGAGDWFLLTHNTGANDPGSATFTVENGMAAIDIQNAGPYKASIMLGQDLGSLPSGRTYTLTFVAGSRDIPKVGVEFSAEETNVSGMKVLRLSSSMNSYSVQFSTIGDYSPCYLLFCLGTWGTGRLYIDSLTLTSSPGPSSEPATIDYDIDALAVSSDAKKVLKYLTHLSNGSVNGTIVGQNCGSGSQIAEVENSFAGFHTLVEELHTATGKWVGMLGIDYEVDRIFTSAELTKGNQALIDHWNRGGLISITWAPLNPWLNDESDIAGNPGKRSDANSKGPNGEDQLVGVDLDKLVNPGEPIYAIWRRKLDRIANALLELKNAGVVVLFRPMQEMNGEWFWYGCATHPDDPAPFVNLYRDMVDYFTNVKGLDNLLWVYSPNCAQERGSLWVYPGGNYVHVVAPTAYGDALVVTDYDEIRTLNRPLGMGEYGPNGPLYTARATGAFDTRRYAQALSHYPMISYFVCWHDWETWRNGYSDPTYCSIYRNLHSNELMNDPAMITLDELGWK